MHTVATGNKILLLFLLLGTALLITCASSCSPAKRYRVMNFFFDGVPKPGEQKKQAGDSGTGQTAPSETGSQQEKWVKIVSRHPDYFNNNCNKCHDRAAANFLRTAKNKLCFSCHQESKFQGNYVHGPVAVKACLTCHAPHESRFRHLLKENVNNLCFQCHDYGYLLKTPPHIVIIKDKKICTGCHAPHASETRFFLRNRGAVEPEKR